MKVLACCFGLALWVSPARAQVAQRQIPLQIAVKVVSVAPFIAGLKEPGGMALDDGGNLVVCDPGAGEILRFDRAGKPLDKLATGLRGPTAITAADGGKTMFVSERGANRVLRFGEGRQQVEMEDVPDPTGVFWDVNGGDGSTQPRALWVVSSSTPKLYRKQYLPGYVERRMVYATIPQNRIERPGFGWIIGDQGAFLLSDAADGRVLMLSPGGRIATFAGGISRPSGLATGPDRAVYVTNESDGGQLIRLSAEGQKVVVAEKLGRPCAILFLDTKTALVSNRDGNVWKITLP